MRTTLDLNSNLLTLAKRAAVERRETLTSVVESALRAHLTSRPRATAPFRFKPLTKRGRPVRGVDVTDRDALYERMDGRS